MSKIFIQLGRLGDLINALPIFHAESQAASEPCRVMCCAEYASLFEGTSYVKCIPFNGTDNELRRAHAEASKDGQAVSLQVIGDTSTVKDITYGPAGFAEAQTDSFQKEPYWLTKNRELWSKQPRPIFDKRDSARERELTKCAPGDGKDKILVASHGRSSPFSYKDLLLELLVGRFGLDSVVCLDTYKADRFYDSLGLLESARCLIAIDSAFLHLAHACPSLPVCALVNDSPKLWYGSAWRANHISHIRYSDFPLRAIDMLNAIEGIGSPASWFSQCFKTTPKLIHIWSKYEMAGKRNAATESWEDQYAHDHWISCPIEIGALGRDSKTHPKVKDDQRQPSVKDVIRLGCYRARLEDIIVLTRSDTQFSESLSEEILTGSLPAYCHRTYRSESRDTWHPQVDLFAFTKKWWMEHQSELPNFFFGGDHFWNRTLLTIVKKAGGREIPFAVYRSPSTSKVGGGKRFQWNELLHNEYESRHGQIVFAAPCAEQLPAVVINRHALDPHAYNGAVIRYKNRLLLAYRYHDQRDLSTALAMAEIDERGNVRDRKPIHLPMVGGSEEDPRLFIHNDDLYLSYVDSTFPAMPPTAVVKYGKLIEEGIWKMEAVRQPNHPGNDMTCCQKNWLFWSHGGKIVCIYSTSPKTVVLEVNGSEATTVAEYDGPRWAWGEIRGGTTPIPYKGALLRFFHSALDYDIQPNRRRYFVGAMTMEDKPPFRPIAISRRPILWGSELDTLSETERSSALQYKTKVIFPLGAVQNGPSKFLLSAGINDSHCGLFTISEKQLNLK